MVFFIFSDDGQHLTESEPDDSEEEGEDIVGEDMDKFVLFNYDSILITLCILYALEITPQNLNLIHMMKVSLMRRYIHQ